MRLKRPTIIRSISTIVLLMSVLVAPCHGARTHAIQKGETLARIAHAYYGDPAKAAVLMAFNSIRDSRTLVPGQRIVIPEIKLHRVQTGDTLALIAKKYLKDTQKHQGLAHLNHIKDPKSLSPGTTIVIPVEIGYTVKKGDSLSSIAEKFYGDVHAYALIAVHNDIRDPANLEPGTSLTLPIADLRIVKRETRSEAPTQPPGAPLSSKGMPYLQSGVEAYFKGEYRGSVMDLQQAVLLGLENEEDLSKALRFLAYAYVALNERERAKDAFQRALEIDPALDLDPVYVSPKIMDVFREAKAGRNS
jgi:LysM repeat protein